jgi:hypothetical protein
MRSTRTLLIGFVFVALTACGGTPSSTSTTSTGGQPSTAASDPGSGTPAATPGGGGPGTTDIGALESELVPPNSSQLNRQEVPQGVVVAYQSSDSVGDLKSFYVQKLAALNMTVITTNEAANTWAVAFGNDNTASGLGGSIAIQNAGDVSNVIVTLADTSGG